MRETMDAPMVQKSVGALRVGQVFIAVDVAHKRGRLPVGWGHSQGQEHSDIWQQQRDLQHTGIRGHHGRTDKMPDKRISYVSMLTQGKFRDTSHKSAWCCAQSLNQWYCAHA